MKNFFLMIAGISALLFTACSTSPTGRKQLILMPDGQMNAMGASAFTEMKQKLPRETNSSVVQYVNCVGKSILNELPSDQGQQAWEIQVFKSDEANAFALPGGKMGVYSGLLKVAKSQDQLAAVLGHEVGHVIARHGSERVSQALATQGGLAALDGMMRDPQGKLTLFGALGVAGLKLGVELPHSRTQESEADQIGIDLMAKAGFDPRESVELWKNMSQAGGSPPEFMSTHPSHETRIDNLKSWMNDAIQTQNKAIGSGKRPKC